MRVRFDMASCRVDQKRTLTEHFKQRAVIKFCANSELTPTETLNFFSEHNSWKTCSRSIYWHKRFRQGRAGISGDFCRAGISGDFRSGGPRNSGDKTIAKHVQLLASRYKAPEKRGVKIAVRSAVAKFGVDFKK